MKVVNKCKVWQQCKIFKGFFLKLALVLLLLLILDTSLTLFGVF